MSVFCCFCQHHCAPSPHQTSLVTFSAHLLLLNWLPLWPASFLFCGPSLAHYVSCSLTVSLPGGLAASSKLPLKSRQHHFFLFFQNNILYACLCDTLPLLCFSADSSQPSLSDTTTNALISEECYLLKQRDSLAWLDFRSFILSREQNFCLSFP